MPSSLYLQAYDLFAKSGQTGYSTRVIADAPKVSPILHELLGRAFFNAQQAKSGSAVDEGHPLDAHRLEHRFLLKNTNQQLPALKSWATVNNTYRTHTVYIDTPRGTWSKGKSQVKFRLRHYNNEPQWWIELKTNISGVVDKTRRLITLPEMDTLGLVPVSAVTYNRQEFEAPSTSTFRCTIDDDLLCWYLPFNMPLSQVVNTKGQPIAKLERNVLELKQHESQPQWLNLPERWNGSKSRWSLAALAGRPDTVAPSTLNNTLELLREAVDKTRQPWLQPDNW